MMIRQYALHLPIFISVIPVVAIMAVLAFLAVLHGIGLVLFRALAVLG
jgi:hypothetical protein